MIELNQEVLTLRLDPEAGHFSILPNDQSFPAILDASLAVFFKKDGENRHGLDLVWEGCQVSEQSQSGEQGTVKMVRCIVPCHTNGMSYEVTFGVAEDYPLALWKVKVLNQSNSPIYMDRIELLNNDFRPVQSQKGCRTGILLQRLAVLVAGGLGGRGWRHAEDKPRPAAGAHDLQRRHPAGNETEPVQQ